MFIIDNILLSPVKGFMWIVRELHNAAQQEIKGEADQLTHRLSTLYMMLETGQISQAEFDAQEQEILARLDAIEADEQNPDDDNDTDDDDDTESDDETDDTDGDDDVVVAGQADQEAPSLDDPAPGSEPPTSPTPIMGTDGTDDPPPQHDSDEPSTT